MKIDNLVFLTVGAGLGSVITAFFVKNYYEKAVEEEIEALRGLLRKKEVVTPDEIESNHTLYPPRYPRRSGRHPWGSEEEKIIMSQVEKNIHDSTLKDYSKYSSLEKEEEVIKIDTPYVISPDEFGENDDYETVSLVYYSDDVLADDNDDTLEGRDIVDTIGVDALSSFGEYEEDSVFVRNDRLKCDYEILLDERTYAHVISKKPPHRL